MTMLILKCVTYYKLDFVFQVLLREYNFESRHKPVLTEEDILNMFPVVKHVNIKAKEAHELFTKAQISIQQGKDLLHSVFVHLKLL